MNLVVPGETVRLNSVNVFPRSKPDLSRRNGNNQSQQPPFSLEPNPVRLHQSEILFNPMVNFSSESNTFTLNIHPPPPLPPPPPTPPQPPPSNFPSTLIDVHKLQPVLENIANCPSITNDLAIGVKIENTNMPIKIENSNMHVNTMSINMNDISSSHHFGDDRKRKRHESMGIYFE